MREIKFKLYLQNEETGAITSVEFNYAQIFSGLAKEILEKNYPRWFVIANCQYTGLHDKNGKEIYEGDVVSYPKEPFVGKWVIEYVQQTMRFVFTKDIKDKEALTFMISSKRKNRRIIGDSIQTIEIVGNIYEKPELIEK